MAKNPKKDTPEGTAITTPPEPPQSVLTPEEVIQKLTAELEASQAKVVELEAKLIDFEADYAKAIKSDLADGEVAINALALATLITEVSRGAAVYEGLGMVSFMGTLHPETKDNPEARKAKYNAYNAAWLKAKRG